MFVVCGEALMDVFAGSRTPTGLMLDARIGGSPFNVALGLARLGQPVAFFGGVSRGFLGDRLLGAMADEGIGTDAVTRLDAPTTLSLVGVDARGVPSYAFYGEGCADRALPRSALARLPANAQALHLGSYTMVVEPVASVHRALIEQAGGRCLISYDPNVRLNVHPELAAWRDALDWMSERTQLLKVSAEDLALLHPGDDAETLARRWLARGVALVVVTRGGEGAWALNAEGQVLIPAAPAQVADTVGAGDSFQAALLAWLAEHVKLNAAALRGLDAAALADALGFATRAAAITCSRRGADMPRRAELG